MQRWCRNTETACSMTSKMGCAETWCAQVGKLRQQPFTRRLVSMLTNDVYFLRLVYPGNRHSGRECSHQFWLSQRFRDLPTSHWKIRWGLLCLEILSKNVTFLHHTFIKVNTLAVPQDVLVTWVWLSTWLRQRTVTTWRTLRNILLLKLSLSLAVLTRACTWRSITPLTQTTLETEQIPTKQQLEAALMNGQCYDLKTGGICQVTSTKHNLWYQVVYLLHF